MMAAKYRAEQVGSLLRPREVLDAQAANAQGTLPLEALREIENKAILETLEMQRQAGIDVLSDGEYRRSNWAGDFVDAMEGYVHADPPIRFQWKLGEGEQPAPEETMRDIRAVAGQGAL